MKSMKMFICPSLLSFIIEIVADEKLPVTISPGEPDSEGYIEVLFEYEAGFQFSEFFDNMINKHSNLIP